MKLNTTLLGALVIAATLAACGGGETKTAAKTGSFCTDSACVTEPMRFGSPTPDKPYVTFTFKDCRIDSIHVFKGAKEGTVDIGFADAFPNNNVKPGKSLINADIVDGVGVWIKVNDCPTGRGYLVKLPIGKTIQPAKYSSAINSVDPKFKVADGLVSYYDNTFLYVEDIQTGKVAKTLLTDKGVKGIDHDDVHSFIDSVNISKDHLYAKIKYEGKDIIHDVPLTFK